MKRFKKQVSDAGILKDYYNHTFYTAPSLKKKEKSEAARKRAQKLARKKAKYYSE